MKRTVNNFKLGLVTLLEEIAKIAAPIWLLSRAAKVFCKKKIDNKYWIKEVNYHSTYWICWWKWNIIRIDSICLHCILLNSFKNYQRKWVIRYKQEVKTYSMNENLQESPNKTGGPFNNSSKFVALLLEFTNRPDFFDF